MAARSDIEVDFELNPRLLEITSTSEEVSVQDSHDTLSDIQDTAEGEQFPFLVSTAGGEDLGGGTTVGLTTVLNNAQYAFQSTSPIETGTVTTGHATNLIDTTATFVTNAVKRGDWVINFTDQSVTEVLSVTSETELVTRGLRNGTGNTFDVSDAYKVWEVREAELSGGNFTAVDDMDASMNPAFPVFGRTFRLTASSSATATSQAALEAGLLAGQVVVDVVSGTAGTGTDVNGNLIGTFIAPSSNMADALTIATTHGVKRFLLMEDTTLNTDLSAGFTFMGISPFTLVTCDAAANVTSSVFENITVVGELDGINSVKDSSLNAVTEVSGRIERTSFNSNVTINADTLIFNCLSNISGGGYPIVTTVTGAVIQTRDFHGSMGLAGVVDGSHSVGGDGGRLVIASSCTGGTIHVRGSWFEILDSSGVGCTVLDERSLDSNVKFVNDIEVIGDGTPGNEWGPAP